MNRVKIVLTLLAVFALAATAHAATLSSEYTFDEGTGTTIGNSVTGAPAGTLIDGTTVVGNNFGEGAVGSYSLTLDGSDCVNTTTAAYPKLGGLQTGSYSAWIKTSTLTRQFVTHTSGGTGNQTTFSVRINSDMTSNPLVNAIGLELRGTSATTKLDVGGVGPVITDDVWHLLTLTWNASDGTAGSGNATIYVDGTALSSLLYKTNTIASTDAFTSEFRSPQAIGAGSSSTTNPPTFSYTSAFVGGLDDIAAWSGRLTATEAMALYRLGTSSLDYGATDAQRLFNLYAAGTGTTTTSDGKIWEYSSALTGTAGFVVNDGTGLVLGDSGIGGVQVVPEPGTLALLATGLFGLLVYVWRKRS
jgi:hypothetical protein